MNPSLLENLSAAGKGEKPLSRSDLLSSASQLATWATTLHAEARKARERQEAALRRQQANLAVRGRAR